MAEYAPNSALLYFHNQRYGNGKGTLKSIRNLPTICPHFSASSRSSFYCLKNNRNDDMMEESDFSFPPSSPKKQQQQSYERHQKASQTRMFDNGNENIIWNSVQYNQYENKNEENGYIADIKKGNREPYRNTYYDDNEYDSSFEYEYEYDNEDDSYYYDYNEDFMEENDEDERDSGDGNYWINQPGRQGLDQDLVSRPKRRWQQPQKDRNQVDDYDYNDDEEFYDRPRPVRDIRRSTFRSGTPEPARFLKNFYNSFFWFGMDMSQSTVPSDKTIFGGTKGKFNGLDIIYDRNYVYDSRTDTDYETRQEREYERGRGQSRRQRQIVTEGDGSEYETYDFQGRSSSRNSYMEQPEEEIQYNVGRTRDQNPFANADIDDDTDIIGEQTFPQNTRRSSRTYTNGRRTRRKSQRQIEREQSVKSTNDALQKEVSQWFTSNDSVSEYNYNNADKNLYNEDYEDEYIGNPVEVFLDKIFNIDTEERRRMAEAYEHRMGIKKRQSTIPYRQNDQNDPTLNSVINYDTNSDEVIDIDTTYIPEPSSVEVQKNVTVAQNSTNSTGIADTITNISKLDLSWKEREDQVNQVPPRGIPAWGPNGEIEGGKDAREIAKLNAQEEISEAEELVTHFEERVEEARENVILLQTDARLLKKRINSMNNRKKSLIAQLQNIEGQISRASIKLRKRENVVKQAQQEVNQLRKKHWAVLSQCELLE